MIIEYKRRQAPSLINQKLFYLDWIQDHRADYQMLVYGRLGACAPDGINWTAPRLICVTPRLSRYDVPAAKQYKHRVELIRYHWFGHDLLMLEPISTRFGGEVPHQRWIAYTYCVSHGYMGSTPMRIAPVPRAYAGVPFEIGQSCFEPDSGGCAGARFRHSYIIRQ